MTTETLQLHHIANNLPYGFKFISELDKPYYEHGNQPVHTCNGMVELFGDMCLNAKERNDAYPVHLCKPIMRHISSLAKPVRLKGYDEPKTPIVELAKIAFTEYEWTSEYGVCFTDKGNEFDYNKGAFRYSDEQGYEVFVKEQWKLFAKLDEWMINYRGIPDNLVEYITDEFNPYVIR